MYVCALENKYDSNFRSEISYCRHCDFILGGKEQEASGITYSTCLWILGMSTGVATSSICVAFVSVYSDVPVRRCV